MQIVRVSRRPGGAVPAAAAMLLAATFALTVGRGVVSGEEKTNPPVATSGLRTATATRANATAVPSAPSATASRVVPQVGPITPRRVSFALAGPPRLAVVESDGTVSVWLLDQPAAPRCFSWIRTDAMDALFSADGKRLITAGRDGALSMWTADGSFVRRVAAHTGPVRALAVAGDLIVSGGMDGKLRLWTAELAPRGEPFDGHKGGVLSVAVSKQRDIASFGVDQMLRIWSPRGTAYRESLSLGLGRPGFSQQLSNLIVIDPRWGWGRQVSFAAKDDLLAVAPFDGKLRLFHKDGKPVAEMPQAHEGQQVQTVAFVGSQILSAGFDKKLRFWMPDGQSAGPAVEAHGAPVVGLDVSPDGTLIASTGTDDAVHLSDATGKPVAELPLRSKDRIRSIAVSADGKLIAAGNSAGEIWLWSRAGAVHTSPIKAAEKGVATVALSRRNDLVASSCARGDAICIWTADGLPVVGPLTGLGYEIPNLAFSADGRFLAHGHNYAAKVLVRRTDTGEETRAQLVGLKAETTAVAFFPDGEMIAAASTALRFWKLDGSWISPEMLPKIGIMLAIAISSGGDRIASAGLDGLIYLWKPDGSPDGEPIAGHVGRVSALSFTAEGEVLSGGEDGELRIWNLEKRQPRIVNVGAPIVAVGSAGKLNWAATRRWEVHFYGNGDALRATLIVEPSGALVTAADGSYSGQGEIIQKLQGFDEKGTAARLASPSERGVEAAFEATSDAAHAPAGGAKP